MEYPWWSLSECELDAAVYNILAPFSLSEPQYKDWEDFENRAPELAYAWSVGARFNYLDESFIALRPIVQMLGVNSFPIHSEVRPITRYEWLRAIIDLALFRITAIRDCCFFLVSEVFEFQIKPIQMSISILRKQNELQGSQILDVLSEIASIGEAFRIERNERAHQGKQREFGESSHDTLIFKVVAMSEGSNTYVKGFDLLKEYNEQASVLYEKFVAEVEMLQKKVLLLQQELLEPFQIRFESKEAAKAAVTEP